MNNNLSKKIINDEGREETIVATSSDNYNVELDSNYTLVGKITKKRNKLAEKFKGSILGADIGVKSGGFSTVAILATVIALAVIAALYFIWRF